MQKLKDLYKDLINGNQPNYNQIVDIVSKAANLIPELDIGGEGGIQNYSKQQLEQIVIRFINKIQQQQLNRDVKVGSESYNKQKKQEDINYNKSIWESKYKDYYELHKNNLKEIPKIINIDSNHQSVYDKIYQSFFQLNLLQDVIFNIDKRRFELVAIPDSTGKHGMKLTLPLFKKIINYMSGQSVGNLTVNVFGNKQDLSNYFIDRAKSLHINTLQSNPCQYIINLFRKLSLEQKTKKINKVMSKKFIDRDNLSTKQVADKIFNKIKQANSQNNENAKSRSKYQVDKYNNENKLFESTPIKDVFRQLKKGTTDVKVLDVATNVDQQYKKKKQEKLSKKLLKGLKYIPEEQNNNMDISASLKGQQEKNQIANILTKLQEQLKKK